MQRTLSPHAVDAATLLLPAFRAYLNRENLFASGGSLLQYAEIVNREVKLKVSSNLPTLQNVDFLGTYSNLSQAWPSIVAYSSELCIYRIFVEIANAGDKLGLTESEKILLANDLFFTLANEHRNRIAQSETSNPLN